MAYRRHPGFTLGPIGFLVIVNLILYITVSIRPDIRFLLGFHPEIFQAMPWTMLTSIFVHAPFPRIGHILANMITLYFFGSYLLRLVGERNFLIVYFGGGILGNIFYAFLFPPFVQVIGASGAVFAVGGALAVLRPRLRVFIIPIPVPIPLWLAAVGAFLLLSLPYTSHGIAWQGHLGGLVFGLAMAYFYFRRKYYLH